MKLEDALREVDRLEPLLKVSPIYLRGHWEDEYINYGPHGGERGDSYKLESGERTWVPAGSRYAGIKNDAKKRLSELSRSHWYSVRYKARRALGKPTTQEDVIPWIRALEGRLSRETSLEVYEDAKKLRAILPYPSAENEDLIGLIKKCEEKYDCFKRKQTPDITTAEFVGLSVAYCVFITTITSPIWAPLVYGFYQLLKFEVFR